MAEEMTEVRTSTSKLVEEGVKTFKSLEKAYEETDEEFTSDVLIGFVAGFQSALAALGLRKIHAIKTSLALKSILEEVFEVECDCKNCVHNRKK